MFENAIIHGHAAVLGTANLDTDQIMPKQFLRGIDKGGLADGLLYDLRFDNTGQVRPDFVLNQPAYAETDVLITGPNFGCGSSREHAVWGMQQYGLRAVIGSSFAEIFYSNAMNNRLLLVTLHEGEVQALMRETAAITSPLPITIDVERMIVSAPGLSAGFTLSERHRHMFLEGLDMIGASLRYRDRIQAFAQSHWAQQPWLKDVAQKTRDRLNAGSRISRLR